MRSLQCILCLPVAILVFVSGCAMPPAKGGGNFSSQISQLEASPLATQCTVIKLYDGDTIGCDFNGNGRIDNQAEHVRLLGIDTPEMHYSRKNKTGKNQPFAKEAMDFVQAKAMGKPVTLLYDERPFDKYDRRLAYVYVGKNVPTITTNHSLNQQLVEEGLAKLMFIPPNQLGLSTLKQAEVQAKEKHLGLWRHP
jgi:micrococcal nuclease